MSQQAPANTYTFQESVNSLGLVGYVLGDSAAEARIHGLLEHVRVTTRPVKRKLNCQAEEI